jgi:hypothetical protein
MNYYFNSQDVRSIQDLRRVRTVTNQNGETSENKLLVLYSIDYTGSKNIIQLLNGSNVGINVANVVHLSNLDGLPVLENRNINRSEVKLHYEIVYDPDVARTQTIYQLFVGNMNNSNPNMTTFHSNADAVLQAISDTMRLYPSMPHSYCIKYEYNKEPVYLPLFERRNV